MSRIAHAPAPERRARSRRQSFRQIVNNTTRNPHARSAEIIARYTDIILRKGAKGTGVDRDVDQQLAQTVRVRRAVTVGVPAAH